MPKDSPVLDAQGAESRASPPHSSGRLVHFLKRLSLAPTPLNENPSAIPVHPAMCDPASTGPWWYFPFPRNPDISATVPLLISGYPNIIWTGSHTPSFHYRSRRRYPNHDFRSECTKRQRARENDPNQFLT